MHYSAKIAPIAQFVKTVQVNHLAEDAVCHFEIDIPQDCERIIALYPLAHGMDAAITAMEAFFDINPPNYQTPFAPQFWQTTAGRLSVRWAKPGGVFLSLPVDQEMASKEDHLPFFTTGPEFNSGMSWNDYQLESAVLFGDKNTWWDAEIPCEVERLFCNYANHASRLALDPHELSVYVRYERKQQ